MPLPVPRTSLAAATIALALVLAAGAYASPRGLARAADCRPARVIVYAQSDWLRAAQRLAAHASPCAQYYISVPPLAADKTLPRPGQAALIRALGPNFHALAEIHWTTWTAWVSANNSNFAQAGITMRQRLAGAGYDLASGDTWALNEVSSAVRKNTGSSRQNVRDFIRGLAVGDGSGPTLPGVVFVIGIAQVGGDTATYKANLQSWFQDSAFWTDMSAYVSDWAQESYGDIRAYAVAGTSPQQRRDVLEQFLGAPVTLARTAPPEAAAATAYLNASYTPLGNAAWAWLSSYGWTAALATQMQDYVSAQVYAERALSAARGATVDRIGFAWAPSNANTGLGKSEFDFDAAAILDQIAGAIADSGATFDPADPGAAACSPPFFCTTSLPGAAFTTAWQIFSAWSPSTVAISSPPATLVAGVPSGPLTLRYQTGNVGAIAPAPQVVTLTSSSAKGQFSTSATGPWTPTLTVTIPAGASTTPFYYLDTAAGSPTITAATTPAGAGVQVETVSPAAPTSVSVTPATATVGPDTPATFTATVADAFGNSGPATAVWSLDPPALGRITSTAAGAVTLTGAGTPGSGRLIAQVGAVTGAATVTFAPPPVALRSVTSKILKGHLVVTARVVSRGKPAQGVLVTLQIRKGSSLVGRFHGKTGVKGQVVWRSRGKLPRARYLVKATLDGQRRSPPVVDSARGGR